MKVLARTTVVLVLIIVAGATTFTTKNSAEWQTGTLVDQSFTLEDAGCAGNVCGGTYQRTHYVIATDDKFYVANRTGGRLKLTVNKPVRFALDGNRLILIDADGKSHDCHLEQIRDRTANQQGDGEAGPTRAEESALVTVTSTPAGADIEVDGDFVGNAPAELKLKPGKHTIRAKMEGYKDWSREINALGGSKVNLSASLQK
jgi:hypothetical protein